MFARSAGSIAVVVMCVGAVRAQSTVRVSVSSAGAQGNSGSYMPASSGDGRYVAFYSDAANLVSGDSNGWTDVFVRDTQTGQTTRVSVSSTAAPGNHSSYSASISANGRFVAFYSDATNLVPSDTNGWTDVFVRDTQAALTTRVSVDSSGAQGNGYSDTPAISGDGRFVAFRSSVSTFVSGDTNDFSDVFVRDTQNGLTSRASVSSAGVQGNGASYAPSISADGRYVAFFSSASNLVAGDTNGCFDVFVRDTQSGVTTRASVGTAGAQADDYSYRASISSTGRYVAFYSFASNLVPGDSNSCTDVFVRDMQALQTKRVSVSAAGAQANDSSDSPSISADGRLIAFRSYANNLVAGDTNANSDVFVHDTQTSLTTRISLDSAGAQATLGSYAPSVSADGLFVAFESEAANLVTADTNSAPDAFVRNWWFACYLDGDFDGFGAGAPVFYSPTGCGAGYSSNDDDCNDALSSVHPGAAELCNGVDDDCDNTIDNATATYAYCTAGVTTHGCQPAMSGSGTASSVLPSGFTILCSNVEGQRMGLIFYGVTPAALSWAVGSTSYQCIAPPVQRTAAINSGGTSNSCNGALSLDFNAYITAHPNAQGSPYMGGQTFYAQCWFRDPAAPAGTNLSDGLHFTLCN